MTGGRALILAGAGMMPEVVKALVLHGWHVVLPSRRYSPIAVPEAKPGMAARKGRGSTGLVRPAHGDTEQGRAIWVEAGWDRPDELAEKAEAALAGPADLLVAWVHGEYRSAVMCSVERLLAEDASVVEVWPAAATEPPFGHRPSLEGHPTQLVVLGMLSEYDSSRAVCQSEITEGVLTAVRRAVEGNPASVHQIGRTRPMVR